MAAYSCRQAHYADKEKNMDALQKIIIFVAVALVVSGLIWFIFIAH
jgi:hypothetical protein